MTGEHAWFAEHMAAAVCGGLVGTEATRFENHREACSPCARAYEELVELDRRASMALADQRPEAGLEDRVIQRLREDGGGQGLRFGGLSYGGYARYAGRLITGLAATLLLGAIGYFGLGAMQDGRLDRWTRLDFGKGYLADAGIRIVPDTAGDVARLIGETQREIQQTNYDAAARLLDRILAVDPNNDYARGIRPLVLDKAEMKRRIQADPKLRERFDSLLADAEQKKIPYDDILRYPENWPELSARRDQMVEREQTGSAEDRVARAQLEKVLPELKFDATKFSDVVDFMRDVSGANVFVDWKALEAAGISKDAPVTARMKNIKFSSALKTMLKDIGGGPGKLGYTVDEGVITVSTAEELSKNTVTRVYDIRDLLALDIPNFTNAPDFNLSTSGLTAGANGGGLNFGTNGGGQRTDSDEDTSIVRDKVDSVLQLIEETVSPDTWRDKGGQVGSMRELNGQLIVTQTAENHKALEGLLGQLRTPSVALTDNSRSMIVADGGTLVLGGQVLSGDIAKHRTDGRSSSAFTDGPVTSVPGSLGGSRTGLSTASRKSGTPDFNLSSNDGTVNGKFSGGDAVGKTDGDYAYRPGDPAAPSSGKTSEVLAFKPGELFASGLATDTGLIRVAFGAGISDRDKKELDKAIAEHEVPGKTGTRVAAETPKNAPTDPTSSITPTTPVAPPPPPAPSNRKIIRNGEMEFEVESFDASAARIERIASEDGGFVATVNSERLGNGKMKGSVVVRVPPDRLDGFVQKIRALGDLRSQRIGSLDVTKQYTDTESELKACRAMEGRLLDIIKTGKGEVKDLVAAEKELGEWRVRIEKLEGEIRYMSNLIAMSTLTISLLEKDIQAAARAVETETINMGVETEDVEKQYAEVQKAIADAKGRVVDSKLTRHDAGQLSAVITADMPRDAAGPVVDRVKQLGRVARLDRQIAQTAVEGTNVRPGTDLKVEKKETRLCLSLYNLANVAPRQTYNIDLAVENVEEVYRAMTSRPAEGGGRVVTSNLTRPRADQTTGSVNFEVKTSESEAILKQIRDAGTVLKLTISENPDTANVTTAKQGFLLQIVAVASVPPRQSTGVTLAVKDVPAAHNKLIEVAGSQGARMIQNQLNEADRQNITSSIDFEVAKEKAAAIESAIAAAGDTVSRSTQRVAESDIAMETKVRYRLAMLAADRLTPREQTGMQVQVSDVARARDQVLAAATESGGRIIENQLQELPGGRSTAKVLIDLPLGSSVTVAGRAAALGAVVQRQVQRFNQAPEGPLARARVEVLLTAQPTLTRDDGLMAQLREGLSTSVRGLFLSVRLVVIGICLVAPIALALWLVWRLLRRMFRKPVPVKA